MQSVRAQLRKDGARTRLRIRFSAGERPHLFWVDVEGRIRVLSKRGLDGSVEVVITRDAPDGVRQALGELRLPPDAPAGWLERWVEAFAEEVGTQFERFDLRHVETLSEWDVSAAAHGWTR